MSFLASVGEGFLNIAGAISDKVEGIVSAIINFLRNVVNNIYIWFMNLWTQIQNNPLAFARFLATVYVLML